MLVQDMNGIEMKTIFYKLAMVPAATLIMAAALPVMAKSNFEIENIYSSHSGNYLVARAASRARDFDVAAVFYGRAYEENPTNLELAQRAFISAVTAGEFSRAVEMAHQLVSARPDYQLARYVLGLDQVRRGDYTTAREHFSKARLNRIGQLTSGALMAWAKAGERDQEGAFDTINEMARSGGLDNFHDVHTALLADYFGLTKKAAKYYKKAYLGAKSSVTLIQAYGNFLARQGQLDEARNIFNAYQRRSGTNPLLSKLRAQLSSNSSPPAFIQTPRDGMFQALFSLASALADQRNAQVALIYTEMALSMQPKSTIALTLKGEIYQKYKKYEMAIEAYSRIQETSPLYENAQLQIASALDDLKRSDEALKLLDRLAAKNPQNPEIWQTKAGILLGMDRFEDAAEAYGLTLARISSPENRHWRLYYFRGIAYERSGQWEKAEPDLRMALKLRPQQPSVMNHLGYSMIDRGLNLKEALELVKQASALRPNDGYIADSVGWAYYRLGRYKEAVAYLERAVSLLPGDPTVNDHLGDLYWKIGRKLEARFQWAYARDSKPEPEQLKKILVKLKKGLDGGHS